MGPGSGAGPRRVGGGPGEEGGGGQQPLRLDPAPSWSGGASVGRGDEGGGEQQPLQLDPGPPWSGGAGGVTPPMGGSWRLFQNPVFNRPFTDSIDLALH